MPTVPETDPPGPVDVAAADAAMARHRAAHPGRPPGLSAAAVVEVTAALRAAVADQLHAARHQAGATLAQTAAMMPSQPSKAAVQAYCAGTRLPSLVTLVEMCLVLGADPGVVVAQAVRAAHEQPGL